MILHQELPYINPQEIFNLVSNSHGTIWLSSSMLHDHYGRYSFIVINPLAVYTGDKIAIALAKWEELFKNNVQVYDSELPPFAGGLVGYFSYDLSRELEPTVLSMFDAEVMSDVPNYHLGLYNQVIAFDHYKQKCHLLVAYVSGYDVNYLHQLQRLKDLYSNANLRANEATKTDSINSSICQLKSRLVSNFTQTQYIDSIKRAIDYIEAGDIFEVNLTQCYTADVANDYPHASLFAKLLEINSAPFAAYLNLGDLVILSASPERFLSIRQGIIEARPIKGTIKRDSDYEKDQILKNQLLESKKDKAENVMIVDLMRNDLSKICMPLSIKVSQLCEVESFTNVHHLVSVITGRLRPDKSIFDIIPAAFPGGSITGAPKIRAMQIIEELEKCARGVYCGSIGYFGFNGNVDLSIAIRTIVKNHNKLSFAVGGAVTLSSNPQAEYEESLLKGQKLMETLIDFSN